jgi:RNA polymerase sigma-70 factor (ECF subfamily)
MQTDDVLLARVRAGDDRALGIVYDRHGGMVHGLARRVTGDDQLACDITQDVFVYLWEQPDRIDLSLGSLRSFLGVVTHRRAVDAVRRAVRRGRAEGDAFRRAEEPEPLDEQIVAAGARAWCSERIAEALDQLPVEQCAAVVLAYFDGHPYTEVARLLDIPEGTAKSRIRLGLARVRALVGDELQEDR